ncbi:MAG: hypothetical protein ACRDQC_14655, partial [Gaiellales bacterium]
ALAAFVAISAWAIWGPDRVAPDGGGPAILNLRLALGIRVAIHGFFLVALIVMGVAWQLPVLLAVSLLMLGAEWPLGRLAQGRHLAAHALARRPMAEPAPARPAPSLSRNG